MRVGWAIVAGLLLGAAIYFAGQPTAERPHWLRAWTETEPDVDSAPPPPGAGPATPILYRWRDDAGVVNVSDRPPPDRPHERVEIPLDRNVVPLISAEPPPPEESGD